MAKKFLVPIDMCNLEIQNFVAHNLAAAPTGSDGKIYFNTVDSKLYYYNGSSWIALTEGAIYSGTSPINVNGTTISISAATTSAAGSMSSSDKTKLNGIATGAEVNQNAFSNVKVGSTTVAADSKTDTLELVAGSNVTLTPDATNDKVTIAATDTTYSAGTEALLTTGTDTANRVWQPKILHDYIASVVGGVDAMRFKGTVDSNSDLPTTGVKVGDTYMVNTAGTYAGQTCEVGDLIIATATTPTWTVAQTNIDGAITSLTGTSPISVTGSGSSRTVSMVDSGVVAGTYKPTFSMGVWYLPSFSINSKGVITAALNSGEAAPIVTTVSSGILAKSQYAIINTGYLTRLRYFSKVLPAGQTSVSAIVNGYDNYYGLDGSKNYHTARVYICDLLAIDATTGEEVVVDCTSTEGVYDDNTDSYNTTMTFSIAQAYEHNINIRGATYITYPEM